MGLKVGKKSAKSFRSIILGGHILPFLACYTNSGSIIPVFFQRCKAKAATFRSSNQKECPRNLEIPWFFKSQGGPALQHGTF